jgi:uncharacterized membrane protein affecting hemolysin expression
MNFFKFIFTARTSFVLFAFLAFAITILYLGWANEHQRQAATNVSQPAQAH